jgi:hypothetical protein
MSAFNYRNEPHRRKHGPQGYAHYESYRPWLRDEFTFRCVYCLTREQWGRVIGAFDIDHFLPQATNPGLATDYDNLVYGCARCNLIKSSQHVPDPLTVLATDNVRVLPDGILESHSDEAEALILALDLNSPEMVSWRLLWIRIVNLAQKNDADLYRQLMGFPADLPDLSRLRPPKGNFRPNGIAQSCFAQSARGELPDSY